MARASTGRRCSGRAARAPCDSMRRALEIAGEWRGCAFACRSCWPRLHRRGSGTSTLENTARDAQTVDLVYAQDVALAPLRPRAAERVLREPVRRSHAAAASQRAAWCWRCGRTSRVGGRHPWLVHRVAAARRRASAPTRSSFTAWPRAPARRPLRCKPRACRACAASTSIRWRCCRTHRCRWRRASARSSASSRGSSPIIRAPAAPPTSHFVDRALALPEASAAGDASSTAPMPRAATLFSDAPLLAHDRPRCGRAGRALRRRPPRRRNRPTGDCSPSSGPDGTHVVLPAKERASLRPHGQILRTGDQLVPDEASLTTTVWMGGVFHSMVTQGHVSINRFLSTTHSYLGLFRSHGQRVFVERDGALAPARRAVGVRDDAQRRALALPPRGPAARGAQLGGGRPPRAVAHGARAGRARRAAFSCRTTSRSTATTARMPCPRAGGATTRA